MRVFKTLCIDKETNLEMLLSEVSYNTACFWLYSKGFTDPTKTETRGSLTTLEFLTPVNRVFVYDENRGYLLAN